MTTKSENWIHTWLNNDQLAKFQKKCRQMSKSQYERIKDLVLKDIGE